MLALAKLEVEQMAVLVAATKAAGIPEAEASTVDRLVVTLAA